MPAQPKTARRALHPGLLAAVLAVCALGVWWLMPDSATLLRRQLADRSFEAAGQTLARIAPDERAQDPEFFALAEIQIARARLGGRPQEADRVLGVAARAHSQFPTNQAFLREMLLLIPRSSGAAEARRLVSGALPAMSRDQRGRVFEALVSRALAEGQPALAASLYSNTWVENVHRYGAAVEMARLWRQAAEPARALRAVDAFLDPSAGAGGTNWAAATRLRLDLLRENGRVHEAFDGVMELYTNSAPREREDLLPLVLQLSRETSRQAETLQPLKERASSNPTNVALWMDLAQAASVAQESSLAIEALGRGVALEPTNTNVLLRLAQRLEWDNRPGEAFEHYLRALALGVGDAMQPLLRLNAGLYREEDLLDAIRRVPDPKHLEPHTLALARLHVRAADFGAARALYEQLVAREPQNAAVLREYAQLCLDLHDFEKADRLFQRAEALRPGDASVAAALAEVQFRLGRYAEAMERFWRIAQATGSAEAFEHYTTLALALGEVPKAIAALEAKIQTPQTGPRDYEQLAYLANLAGNFERHRQTLLAGIQRFPTNNALRLQATYTFSDRGDFAQAAALLGGHPNLVSDPNVARFYLSLLIQAHRHKEAYDFARTRLPASFLEQASFLELLAQLGDATGDHAAAAGAYRKLLERQPTNARLRMGLARNLASLGRWTEAERILADLLVRPNPEVHAFAAQILAAAGKQREAEYYQRLYIDSRPTDLAAAWRFLGDILLARGDRTGARQAYQKALDIKLETLVQSDPSR